MRFPHSLKFMAQRRNFAASLTPLRARLTPDAPVSVNRPSVNDNFKKQHNTLLNTGGRFCPVADSSTKTTIWDVYPRKGTRGYEPRCLQPRRCPIRPGPQSARALREWPRIPDAHLPEPWSCNWASWDWIEDWYPDEEYCAYDDGYQANLLRWYGVADLEPVMFVPMGVDRGPMILSAGGTYYFFNHDIDGCLKRFEGKYATAEDFIQNADWNSLELMELVEFKV
ncbi:hypothetical protein DFH06DRAFT_1485645 [Mycena polygramma]|nr:hypothetical protein DFH06DRAFT_1485645 [Mycena polygramma]